jgi:hypothetical protein
MMFRDFVRRAALLACLGIWAMAIYAAVKVPAALGKELLSASVVTAMAAVGWFGEGREHRKQAEEKHEPPPPLGRVARYPRPVRSLEQAGCDPGILETCPICGMHDPERFQVGVGVGEWKGWPAHDTCVQWIEGTDDAAAPDSGAVFHPSPAAPNPIRKTWSLASGRGDGGTADK